MAVLEPPENVNVQVGGGALHLIWPAVLRVIMPHSATVVCSGAACPTTDHSTH
jgi:hypothetical protein